MSQSCHVPRPEQCPINQPPHPLGRAVFLGIGRAQDRIGSDIDSSPLDLAEVEFGNPIGVNDQSLDVKAAILVAPQLEVFPHGYRALSATWQEARSGIRFVARTRNHPVAAFGRDQLSGFICYSGLILKLAGL